MFDDWKERRAAIKKHVLNIYDGTNSQNRAELDRFLEFVVGNYDLDDELFAQIQDDLEPKDDSDFQSLQSLEAQEYEYNVLRRRSL